MRTKGSLPQNEQRISVSTYLTFSSWRLIRSANYRTCFTTPTWTSTHMSCTQYNEYCFNLCMLCLLTFPGILQWNLQTTDTLGAGVLSAVERLSLSRRFANKPRPSILRSLICIYLLRGVACSVFMQDTLIQNGHNTKRID